MELTRTRPVGSLADISALEQIPLQQQMLPRGTYEMVIAAAQRASDRPLVINLPNGRIADTPQVLSYGEFVLRLNQAANLFRRLAGGGQARVSHLLPNLPETLLTVLGASAVGVVNGINSALATEHIAAILRVSGSDILVAPGDVVDPDLWTRLPAICDAAAIRVLLLVGPRRHPAPQIAARVLAFDTACAAERADAICGGPPAGGEEIAALFHTGGTTGVPKLARHTHRNQVLNAWLCQRVTAATADDIYCLALPLFHVNAVVATTLSAISAGASVLIAGPRGFRARELAAEFWSIVERHGVTIANLVPTVLATLIEQPITGHDLSRLRLLGSGGAALSPALHRAIELHAGVPVVEGYGLTEATCAVAINPPAGERRAGSIGLRLPYHELKIARLDACGRILADCASGEPGTLLVRGPCVTPGYVEAEKNRELLIGDGWLNTGDLGHQDADGYVWLSGRAKDLIIRGGHNIDPQLIEEPLAAHPDVLLAAAVGKPDAYAGERPTVFVVLREGATSDSEALLAWCRTHVTERAAVPDEVTILPQMPTTAVGKTDKLALRRIAAVTVVELRLRTLGLDAIQFACSARHDSLLGLTVHLRVTGATADLAAPTIRSALQALPVTLQVEVALAG
ncbi:MAG: acyl-CoA synthetase [Sinimarinibacterium sp.]|jgi:fatty-acyl-CoA synthase